MVKKKFCSLLLFVFAHIHEIGQNDCLEPSATEPEATYIINILKVNNIWNSVFSWILQ